MRHAPCGLKNDLSGKRVYQALARDKTLNRFVKSRRIRTGGTKGKRRSVTSQAPPYCFNVNRTSQDHLLLGRSTDVDENVEWTEYSAGPGDFGTSFSLAFGFGTRKRVTDKRVNRELGLLGGSPEVADDIEALASRV
jgi:hypothetical protein